jgi:hypothetical protein
MMLRPQRRAEIKPKWQKKKAYVALERSVKSNLGNAKFDSEK